MSQNEIREEREATEARKIAAPRPRDEQLPLFVHSRAALPIKKAPFSEEELEENRRRSREQRMQTPLFRSKGPGGHRLYGPSPNEERYENGKADSG